MIQPKTLVILTTHFGTNYSGGSTATCEIFTRLQEEFDRIIVIGTEIGNHTFKNVTFRKYKNWSHAISIIKEYPQEQTLFYGDFYNSFLFILAGVPFHFTYHDNWPEMAKQGIKNKFKAAWYVPIYKWIFRKACNVVSVSDYKKKFIRRYSNNVLVIKNGFRKNQYKAPSIREHILMVGNLDERKYGKAIQLFSKWNLKDTQIHIYGNLKDPEITRALHDVPFVRLMGFHKNIPYQSYKLLLHTSVMENLPISFCESLYHKTPVVAFNVGGHPEILENGKTGFLIPPFEFDEMKKSISKVLREELKIEEQPPLLHQHSWKNAAKKYSKELIRQEIKSDETRSINHTELV